VLVLTRQANQSIMIGDEIVISVLEIHGDQVRIGIDAPRHISVHREEIYREVQAANREAAGSVDGPGGLDRLSGLTPPERTLEP
jgi:carbon storage regulator